MIREIDSIHILRTLKLLCCNSRRSIDLIVRQNTVNLATVSIKLICNHHTINIQVESHIEQR